MLPGWFQNGNWQSVAEGAATLAGSLIPGFGGSAAALGLGVLIHLFSNRIIAARTKDHQTAANLGGRLYRRFGRTARRTFASLLHAFRPRASAFVEVDSSMDLQLIHARKQTPSAKQSHPEQPHRAPRDAAVSFGETLREEYQEIIERRKRRHSRHGRGFAEDGAPLDLTGLALSGGGVRSAAFCLGALQAINAAGALNQVDYLSTVSGGGFVGGALSATMQGGARFVFGGAQSGRRASSTLGRATHAS